MLIMEQFPETAASIVSFKVESDVVSLDGHDFLETDAEIGNDGKLHVTVRKSNASRRCLGLGSISGMTPRPSNLTGAEIYSLSSTPRGSNFNHNDFYSMMGFPGGRLSNFGPAEMYSVQSSRGPTPRPSNFEENCALPITAPRLGFYPAQQAPTYPAPNPEIASTGNNKFVKPHVMPQAQGLSQPQAQQQNVSQNKGSNDDKEVHMFVWSSSASPVSEGGVLHVFGGDGAAQQSGRSDKDAREIKMLAADHSQNWESKAAQETEKFVSDNPSFNGGGKGEDEREEEGHMGVSKLGSSSNSVFHSRLPADHDIGTGKIMPPTSVMTRLILIMVWRKLIRNPNTYSSLIGLIWALVSYRWDVTMPKIVDESISILSDAGLGMAMFSLVLISGDHIVG